MIEDVNQREEEQRLAGSRDTRASHHWLTLNPKSPDSKVKGLPLQLIDFAACCAMSHLGLFQKPMGQRQGPIQN